MSPLVRILPGLPAYGPLATPIPQEWGSRGQEGLVVEFETNTEKWVANFRQGLGGLRLAAVHPNQRDAVVIATGDLWVVELETRRTQCLLPAIDLAIDVQDPPGWIFSRQGLAFARLGPKGLLWHTRRLSFDGFDQVRIDGDGLTGLAWSPIDGWRPFSIDIRSGRSQEGAYGLGDAEGWETLAADAEETEDN